MKLWQKIFISILIVSLTTLFVSSYYLINRSHLDNVSREQERSLNDFELIRSALENGIDFNTATDESLKLLLSHYVDFYNQKGIILMLFHNKDKVFTEFTKISPDKYQDLLSVENGSKQIQILTESKQHYIFVSGKMTKADYCLVYARNISNLYLARTRSVYLSIIMAAGLIILLSLLSYLYSRWITKPIELLNMGANAISKGDYYIRIPETKDEFNELGMAFNKMATAVEGRTTELEERAKELQVFIDDLSHEMNTPLTSIQGYSEFLIGANASEAQKQKAAETICTEAKRMKDIYTKLLTLSFAREHDLEFASVKTDDLFSEINDSFLVQLSEHGIHLTILNSLNTLTIDRTLIHMLLCNLIKNSIQATQKDGTILLQAYKVGENSILEVSDNGSGIPKDKINDVMKPFFRVDKSRSRKTGGAGLGLSICKSIADLHHAEIVIDSEFEKGTCIKIIFYNSVTTSLLP